MKKDADLSAAEVAPTSGTGGMCVGMGESSMTPDCEDFLFGSRWDTLCGQRMGRQGRGGKCMAEGQLGYAGRWIAIAAAETGDRLPAVTTDQSRQASLDTYYIRDIPIATEPRSLLVVDRAACFSALPPLFPF